MNELQSTTVNLSSLVFLTTTWLNGLSVLRIVIVVEQSASR